MVALAEQLTEAEFQKLAIIADKVINRPKFDPETIEITEHAIHRARERFYGFKTSHVNSIIGNIRSMLRNSVFITEAYWEDKPKWGGLERKYLLYGAPQGVEFRISPDYKKVLTIINHHGEIRTKAIPPVLKDKMLIIFKKEIRGINRVVKTREKKLPLLEAESNAEIANAKLLILKTTSKKKKKEAEFVIKVSEERLSNYINELDEFQVRLKNVAIAMTTIL
jgi:hypothetical protein